MKLWLQRLGIVALFAAGMVGMIADVDYAGLALVIAAGLTWWIEPPLKTERD